MCIIWSERLCQNHSCLRTWQLIVIFFSSLLRLSKAGLSLGRSDLINTLQPHIHFVSCEKCFYFIHLQYDLLFHTKVNNFSTWFNTVSCQLCLSQAFALLPTLTSPAYAWNQYIVTLGKFLFPLDQNIHIIFHWVIRVLIWAHWRFKNQFLFCLTHV